MSSLLDFLLFNAVVDGEVTECHSACERLDLQVDKGVHQSEGSSYDDLDDSEE